jgi:hypothetical protein
VWVVKTRKTDRDVGSGNSHSNSEAVENVYRAKWLLPCTGFAAKRYFPDWEGIEKFQGPTSTLAAFIETLLLSRVTRTIPKIALTYLTRQSHPFLILASYKYRSKPP